MQWEIEGSGNVGTLKTLYSLNKAKMESRDQVVATISIVRVLSSLCFEIAFTFGSLPHATYGLGIRDRGHRAQIGYAQHFNSESMLTSVTLQILCQAND